MHRNADGSLISKCLIMKFCNMISFVCKITALNVDAFGTYAKHFRLADLIEQHKTALANLEVLDNGKPFAEADFDIQCSIDTFRYYAGWCDKIHGNTIPAGKHCDSIFR